LSNGVCKIPPSKDCLLRSTGRISNPRSFLYVSNLPQCLKTPAASNAATMGAGREAALSSTWKQMERAEGHSEVQNGSMALKGRRAYRGAEWQHGVEGQGGMRTQKHTGI